MPKNRKTIDDDDDNRAAKKSKKKPAKSNTLLFALLGGGLVVLLLGCVGASVIGYFVWGRSPASGAARDGKDNLKGGGGNNSSSVNLDKHNKLKGSCTRKEVEDILGPGESISLLKANELLAKMDDDQRIADDVARRSGVTYLAWYNRSDFIVAAFIPTKKYGDLLVDTYLLLHHPDGAISELGGTHRHPNELERDRDLEKLKK